MTRKLWADIDTLFANLISRHEILTAAMVGSTYTLGYGRDIDYAVLVADPMFLTQRPAWLVAAWEREGNDNYEGNIFVSYRNGFVNFIVMHDAEIYRRYLTAMEVCKALKLQRRHDRVIVCRIVRDGMTAEQAESITVPGEQE